MYQQRKRPRRLDGGSAIYNIVSMIHELSRASRALVALLQNPDDLPQVFTIIEALSEPTYRRVLRRLQASEGGRSLVAERPPLAAMLGDRAALAALPEGSLGRAYLAFMDREGISADGLVQASEADGRPFAGEREIDFVPERLRDTHDLWHTVTGYHGDLVGELCLLAFTFAQTHNPALLLVVIGGAARGFLQGRWSLAGEAYRRGQRAAWLPAVRWETLLARPLAEVREELLVDTKHYNVG